MEETMKKTHVVKWLFRMMLISLMILGCQSKAKAAPYPAQYSPEDIALYTSDTSIVGVNFYYEDELRFYVHDVWHNDGKQWYYDHTNLNGQVGPVVSTKYNHDPIWLTNPSESDDRFVLMLSNLNTHFGNYENYSVIIEHYYNNKFIRRVVETPFQDLDTYQTSYSLMYCFKTQDLVKVVSGYKPSYASYRYKLYKILDIGMTGDILSAPGAWTVTENGKAYYDGEKYIIHSLPTITPEIEGYVCELDGWYSSPEGGKKYEEGDVIEKGITLYPHWNKVPIEYPVKCIDILGQDSTGLKIGESAWMQEYDSVAAGSQLGCIPLDSMYYDGMVYSGCSQRVVRTTDNVIYRYFDYAEYPVQIVDRIISGPNAGKDLLTVSRQGCYKTSVSGSILGTDETVGAYYRGYSYQQSTSAIVGLNGATVYRYFIPVQFSVSFDGNGATSGNMAAIDNCWYDQEYTLIPNNYKKEINIYYDLQAEDAVCDSQGKKASLQWNGWAENRTGGVRYSDKDCFKNLQPSSGETTLYAVWGPAKVTITVVPKRMGYIFAGWSEDPNAAAGNTEFSMEGDTTLYAIWKPDVAKYHVEYYKENSDGNFQMTTQYTFSNYIGSTISIENTIPNYQGFYLDQGSSTLQGTVNGDGSLVLMAYYRRNAYQIVFDTLLGNGAASEYNTLQGVFETEVQIPKDTPQREGYQFMGWTANPDSTQVYVMPGDSYRIPNHNQTLYAIWQPNAYEVKFQNNIPEAESDTVEGVMSDLIGHYQENLIVPECGWTRKGYQFIAWNTSPDGSGDSYQPQAQISSLYQEQDKTVVFYAMWKPLEGEIQYQINVPKHSSSLGKGEMANTKYRYDDQWSLQECRFELPGYDFCGWNTREDGTGDFYQDQEEMYRKLPLSGIQKLFAVWKPRTDTKFYLQIEKNTLDTQEAYQEIMTMEGETDSSVSDAIVAFYQKQGVSTSTRDFVSGFTVINTEVLEQNTVKADEQTIISLKLERKKYRVQILRDVTDLESDCYLSQEILYETMYRFPEDVDEIGNVKSYIDQEGNRHFPGEEIKIDQEYFFMAEHSVTLHIGNETQESFVPHNMPLKLDKPEEKVYYFRGWYWDKTYRDFAGNADDILYFTEDCELYAKWSKEKVIYQIQYDFGDYSEVVFLENPVYQYHCGDKIVLPVAAQLLIPTEYEFVGWYNKQDTGKSIVTMISESEIGNKIYCLQLRKKNEQVNDSDHQEENSGNSGQTSGGQEENSGSSGETSGDQGENPGNSGQISENPEEKPGNSDQYSSTSENTEKELENKTPQGSNNVGEQKNPGSVSDQKDMKQVKDAVSPIHSSKGKAAKTSALSFRKGKVTYCCNHTRNNTVKVVAVDQKSKRIKIPSSVSWEGARYFVTQIDKKAFFGCLKLKKVTIGNRVTQIGTKAFYGCKNLRIVVFQGKKISEIQKKAFAKTNRNVLFSIPKPMQKKYVHLLEKSTLRNIRIKK